jgi:hypothetical protein
MTITKSNAGLAILVAGGLAVPLLIQHRTHAKLREQNAALQQQLAALDNQKNQPVAQTPVADDRTTELLRLRGEVALLRRVTNELATLRADNQRLRTFAADAAKNSGDQPTVAYATQRGRVAKILAMPLLQYASDNQGRFPAPSTTLNSTLPKHSNWTRSCATPPSSRSSAGNLNWFTRGRAINSPNRRASAVWIPARSSSFGNGSRGVRRTANG